MTKSTYITILGVALFAFQACTHDGTSHKDEHAHGHADEHAHDHEDEHADEHTDDHAGEHKDEQEDEVHLVDNQMKAMDIKLGNFQELNLSTTVKSSGQLELPPQNKASVSSLIQGRVKSIQVVAGDKVRKGQVLAYLEDPGFIDLQQQYLRLKQEVHYMKLDFERKKKLISDGAVSQEEYENSASAYFSTLPNFNAVQEKLKMLGTNLSTLDNGTIKPAFAVRSPINGYVRLIETNIGKFMSPEQEMIQIVDNDHIHIDLRVYEKDIHLVKEGQKVMFTLPNQPDEVMEGKIFAVGKAFEDEQRAMMVHAEITDKTDNVMPGMYVDARIVTDNRKVRALPNDAIVSEGGLNYIFVLKPRSTKGHEDESVFRKIEVNLGASDIGFTEVIPTYKLQEQAQIVVQGAFYLLAEMKKGEGGHGHHH